MRSPMNNRRSHEYIRNSTYKSDLERPWSHSLCRCIEI